MGILNVTPDSFSDGGRFHDPDQAVAHGLRMQSEGAAILDVGGESSRPGAEAVSAAEECRRVLPVIERLRQQTAIPLSIDTTKAAVAEAALACGADIVNDISALTFDPAMLEVVRKAGAGAVLMHMQGTPQTMQENPLYNEAPVEIARWLGQQLDRVRQAGIPHNRLVVDPGIGFGKTLMHNLEILHELRQITSLDRPVLIGTSRKRFIGEIGCASDTDERMPGSLAALACAVYNGAHIVRVHDVRASWQAARIAAAIRDPQGAEPIGLEKP